MHVNAQGPGTAQARRLEDDFDAERALTTLRALCAPVMSGRAPGTPGHRRATEFLVSLLRSHGLDPRLDHFPIARTMRLTAPPTLRAEGDGTVRQLTHRAQFAEHPRSAPMSRPVTGTVAEEPGPGQWAVVRGSTRGEGFTALAERLAETGVAGILAAQEADASGYLTKRVQGPPPVGLPVVALRPDLLESVTGSVVTAYVPLVREPATGANILVTLPGRDPDARPLLMSAHYDGVGSDPELHFPCAGDNASGVAVLCEAARVLHAAGPGRRPVLLALVDAEEIGTVGSGHHARTLAEQGVRPDALNLDMAGKYNGQVAVELGPGEPLPAHLVEALDSAGRSQRLPLFSGQVSSDNRRYASAGFPSAGIGLGAAHYHSPLDAPERIDPDALGKAGRLLLATLGRLDDRD
jgi:hypothetical protein